MRDNGEATIVLSVAGAITTALPTTLFDSPAPYPGSTIHPNILLQRTP
jgi:hypothetical protein